MRRRFLLLAGCAALLALSLAVHIALGAASPPLGETLRALARLEVENYDQSVILYQRVPRALIALYVGAVTAVAGSALQGLIRNPLASPSTLGVNAGATLAVVAGALLLDLGTAAQGLAALAGAVCGFLLCLAVARLAGRGSDPRGLSLILAGALVSMLLVGATNAFLLSDPTRRADFLGWVSGNINHAYIDRLRAFWWIGLLAVAALAALARPLTLILLGAEKAASAGVNVPLVSRLALAAAVLGAGSAVAICGPVGFIGLVVPHLVRPLVGASFALALPACALVGASLGLIADFGAREAFRPYVLHTGLIMDLFGGLAFLVIVKRFYLAPSARSEA